MQWFLCVDGLLLKQLSKDPELSCYSVIILDEAHERPLNADILFGLLKGLAGKERTPKLVSNDKNEEKRDAVPPLKVVVTSATLEVGKFAEYFNGCPVINVPGRMYPVEIIHSIQDHSNDYEHAAVQTVIDIHMMQPPGDILVFLTGQAEIDRVCNKIQQGVESLDAQQCGDLFVLPLHASLPPELQSRAFVPPTDGTRRCIVATNIAETSVTVDGVVYVVDCGFVKQKEYDPRSGIDALVVVPISKVQAKQRAGRAGRAKPGVCFRLYTREMYEKMPETTAPEIQRSPLTSIVLYLKSLSLARAMNILDFDFIDKPDRSSIEDSLKQLYVLGALDIDGNITGVGEKMAELPLDPSLARSVITAKELNCVDELVTIASMLTQESSIFHGGVAPQYNESMNPFLRDRMGDHIFFLRLFECWKENKMSKSWCERMGIQYKAMKNAKEISNQLLRLVRSENKEVNLHPGACEKAQLKRIRMSLAQGYGNNVARRLQRHNGYKTMSSGTLAQIHPCSSGLSVDEDGLLPEWIIYHELLSTSKIVLKSVCPVEREWLEDTLYRFQTVDLQRLSGVMVDSGAHKRKNQKSPETLVSNTVIKHSGERRNDDEAIAAAKARYLARKNESNARKKQKHGHIHGLSM